MNSADKLPAAHILLGKSGEKTAAEFLQKNKYRLLDKNWRSRHLELDLVCEKNNEIFFIEVKTRKDMSHDKGFGAITPQKIARIAKAAQLWLLQNGLNDRPCHFDVICLYGRPENFYLRHYKDAFECPGIMGGSNPYW